MTASQPIPWKFIGTTLVKFAPFWCGAALFCGAVGLIFSWVKADTWQANQPLMVREEVTGSNDRLGRFSSQTELLAAQETILEMARNRQVVTAALESLGPPQSWDGGAWPNAKVVDAVAQNCINVHAPETSEFGKTEVVYLSVTAESPARAEAFCGLLFQQLTNHLREVRRSRASSIVSELELARDIAKNNLDESTQRLARLESSVGMDLGELRGLSESLAGDGGASRIRSELERDLRQAEVELKQTEALQELLLRGQRDTTQLLVSDGELLSSQPTLQRLKSGLIDAQLEASQLSGRFTANHPRMQAALKSQETIRAELRAEIGTVIQTMQPTRELGERKVATLRQRLDDLEEKLTKLATIRAEYSARIAEVSNRTTLYSNAQAALSEAQALLSAATNTDLLAMLGPPKAAPDPLGPGTAKTTVGAVAAGLLLGLGGVFLVAPGAGGPGFGRRLSDSWGGRRAADRQAGAHPELAPTGQHNTDRRSVNRLTGQPNSPMARPPRQGPSLPAPQNPQHRDPQQLDPRQQDPLKQDSPQGMSISPPATAVAAGPQQPAANASAATPIAGNAAAPSANAAAPIAVNSDAPSANATASFADWVEGRAGDSPDLDADHGTETAAVSREMLEDLKRAALRSGKQPSTGDRS